MGISKLGHFHRPDGPTCLIFPFFHFEGDAGVRQPLRRSLRGDPGDFALRRAREKGQNKGGR